MRRGGSYPVFFCIERDRRLLARSSARYIERTHPRVDAFELVICSRIMSTNGLDF